MNDTDDMLCIDSNDVEIKLMGVAIGRHTDLWNAKEHETSPSLIINKHTNSIDLCIKSTHGDNVKISVKHELIRNIYIPANPQLFTSESSSTQVIFMQTKFALSRYQWLIKFYDPNDMTIFHKPKTAGKERIAIFMCDTEYNTLKTNWWSNKMLFLGLCGKVQHIKDDEKNLWLGNINFGSSIKRYWREYDTDSNKNERDGIDNKEQEMIDITSHEVDVDININCNNCSDFTEYIRNDEQVLEPHHGNSLNYASTRKDEPTKTLVCYWVFPAQHEHKQCIMHIENTDYERVITEDEYLNDTIVDFQLMYTYSSWPAAFKDKVYIFTSFFWKKLVKLRSKNTTNEQLQQILRWTKHIKSLFSKEYIIIPKCEHQHWELVIVCYPGKVLNKYLKQNDNNDNYDSNSNESDTKEPKMPCIAILDSLLGNRKSSEFSVIRKWLNLEANNYISKNKEEQYGNDNDIFTAKTMTGYCVRVPKQPNGHDCGCFLLRNALQFGMDKGFKDTSSKKKFDFRKRYKSKEGVAYRKQISMTLTRLIGEQKQVNDKLRLQHGNRKKMLVSQQIQKNKQKLNEQM